MAARVLYNSNDASRDVSFSPTVVYEIDGQIHVAEYHTRQRGDEGTEYGEIEFNEDVKDWIWKQDCREWAVSRGWISGKDMVFWVEYCRRDTNRGGIDFELGEFPTAAAALEAAKTSGYFPEVYYWIKEGESIYGRGYTVPPGETRGHTQIRCRVGIPGTEPAFGTRGSFYLPIPIGLTDGETEELARKECRRLCPGWDLITWE